MTLQSSQSLLGDYLSEVPELDDEEKLLSPHYELQQPNARCSNQMLFVTTLLLFTLALGVAIGGLCRRDWAIEIKEYGIGGSAACTKPLFRREWRSLSHHEQHNYIQAVQCLKRKSSRLGLNQSLYDDFPYVHFHFGGYSHGTAAFLAWHRYFLYTYHRALETECQFTGELTYWNWALDWQDMTASPIWDTENGFGGTGDLAVGDPIVEGHCVTSGPFSNLSIPYLDAEFRPHCLSRGFVQGLELAEQGTCFNPDALEGLLALDDYEAFNIGLEDGPHIAIPRSIRGDFSLFTAPSDPVFFLHHAQLDRLWWIWQGMNPSKRNTMYTGRSEHNSTVEATLDDTIPMGSLAPDVKVKDIIDSRKTLLCYSYW